MAEPLSVGWWGRVGPRWLMLAGVLAWLWPVGPGGRMPVGGDATQFSMGLMAFLRSSIRSGRLPLWNDLWGFGFPGVAESQMGVFYPPHLLLYGLLPTEVAYTTSLVLHTLWGALGASWAARRFGASEIGSALAGFSWATCGFFLIHQPHQWGYTVGSWMPWAWGLAWQLARGEGSRRTPPTLAGVLALQILPGHFQLAFVTEVGILLLATLGGGRSIGRRMAVCVALAGAAPLAAMQLYPTLRLAVLSGSERGFEYLSGFAATPLHLVNYVAPGLFHRSPLWRPIAFDPFHTSPEELLPYVGLIPLFLALGAIRRGWRAGPEVPALAILAVITLLLSLGPYVPGFDFLIRLPGFSFFRAPARWGLATNLALAILAGRGFDAVWAGLKTRLGALAFALAAMSAVLAVILGFELALSSSRGAGWPRVASGFEAVGKALPWSGRPGEKSFREVMAGAYRPQEDLRVQAGLARTGDRPSTPPGPNLAARRFEIYHRELVESTALLLGLVVASAVARKPRSFGVALIALSAADAWLMARHRPFDLGPCRPLVEQSPVLARLAREPRGTRTLDPAQNLFMVVGAAPVSAYRTLDLPAPVPLLHIAAIVAGDGPVGDAARVAGVGVRVLDPYQGPLPPGSIPGGWDAGSETIPDPTLAGWLHGVDLTSATGRRDFALLRPSTPPARAWLIVGPKSLSADGMANPSVLLEAFRDAMPLPADSTTPESESIEVDAPAASMVVLSKTFDPEWRGRWSAPSGEVKDAEVVKVLGGWQGVAVPGPGRWTLRLEYPGRAVWIGLAVSGPAWLAWVVAFLRMGAGRRGVEKPEEVA